MKKLFLACTFLVLASGSFAQTEQTISIANNSGEALFLAFAYAGEDPENKGRQTSYSHGWYRVESEKSITVGLPIPIGADLYYHAHVVGNEASYWGADEHKYAVDPAGAFNLKHSKRLDAVLGMDEEQKATGKIEGCEMYKFYKIEGSTEYKNYKINMK